jgi:integrase
VGVYYRKARARLGKGNRKIWWISFTLNGRQIFESSHSTSKRFAEKLLAIRKAEIAEARYNLPSSNPPRLKEWTTDFLATVQHASTKKRYTSSIKHLHLFFGEKTRLTDISVSRIEAFKKKRLTDGLTPAGCNRDLAVLRHLLNLAVRQRLIVRNPFTQVDMLDERKTRKQPHIVTYAEQDKLLAHAERHLRTLIILLTETGLRVGKEALHLKWTDFDFQNSQVTITSSKSLAGRRCVPLSELCRQEMQRWKALMASFSEFVFPNMKMPSKPIGSVRKTWSTAVRKAGLEPFPIYSLRATFASRLSAAGVPDGFVSQMLGHAGGLLQTYSKAVDEYRRDAIRKLEELRKASTSRHEVATPISTNRPN